MSDNRAEVGKPGVSFLRCLQSQEEVDQPQGVGQLLGALDCQGLEMPPRASPATP